MDDSARLVRGIPLFASLDDAEIERVRGIATRKLFKRGDVVVRQGEAADAAYVVVHGRLKVSVTSGEKEAVLGLMGPGEVFGELAILDSGVRTATVRAIEPTQLVVLARERFDTLLKSAPGVAYKVLRHVARRLRLLTEHVEAATTRDVGQRLAKKLLDLSESQGVNKEAGVRIAVRLSQTELGEMIGATRESVNKHLRVLARDGIATHARGEVFVRDQARLRALATGETPTAPGPRKRTSLVRRKPH